ncbi:MAG: sulfatase-like hydrolase/transferase [Eubacteriales bacterium]
MKRPNILVFMTDQQRGDSVYPKQRAISPNVTKFAKEGVTFSNAHTIAPHCCPSRATFFSGLYPSEHGVWNNVEVGNALSKGLYEGIRLFSEDLKESGYRTYFSGKWHVSAVENPLHRGFDTYRVDMVSVPNTKYNGDMTYKLPEQYEWKAYENCAYDGERKLGQILRNGYGTYTHYGEEENPKHDEDIIFDAIDIIKNRSNVDKEFGIDHSGGQPWFQYVGPVGPHDPYFVPQEYLDLYQNVTITLPENFKDILKDKPGLYRKIKDKFDQLSEAEHIEAMRHYLAYCTYEDFLFGEVMKALEESGEKDNTLVIYLSDHGDYMGEHGLWCKGLPCFESAYHIPAICRWPEGITSPNRIIEDFITLADFAPTFLEVAGIQTERHFTGHSLLPYLKNEKPKVIQDAFFTQTNGNELYGIQRSVTTKEWKYVYNGFDYDELYDLKNDPLEMYNVIGEYKESEILKELSLKLWKFARKTNDVCINSYILVGLAPYGPGIIFE